MKPRLLIFAACLFALLTVACGTPGERARSASNPATAKGVVDATVPSADGVLIHYHAEGEGAPAVVFVHCWSCDASYWSSQMSYLAPRHRVVAIDLAGHGSSGRNRSAWTIPAFARDVQAVVEALDLKEVVLVGHSMGGPVIVEAARLMPDRVIGLVPVDTLQNVESKWDPAGFRAFLDGLRKDFRGSVHELVRGIMPKGADPLLVERIASGMGNAPPEIALGAMQGLYDYDVLPALRGVKAPIHAINGSLLTTRVEINRKYAPGFEADVIPGVGHFPMFEAPQAFDRLLDSALAGFSDPGAPRPNDPR